MTACAMDDVSPGGTITPEVRAAYLATIPLGRFSTPLDVANACLYLASDEASMISGVCIEVDGARWWQKFRFITWPSLQTLYVTCTLLSMIWTLGDFNSVYLLTGGGPPAHGRPPRPRGRSGVGGAAGLEDLHRRRQPEGRALMALGRKKKGRRGPGLGPFKAGLIALVIVGAFTFFGFTKLNPFSHPYEVTAVFKQASNIKPRSPVRIAGVTVGAAVRAARQKGLLVNGGGHAMAAGLTVARGKLAALRAFLVERVGDDMARSAPSASLGLDGALTVEAASRDLVTLLEKIGPFGVGNAEPRFAFADARVAMAEVVGTEHVRCMLAGPANGRLKGIAFRAAGTDLGRALLAARGSALHVAGRLEADDWQGRERVQLIVEDAALPRPR